MSFAIRFIALDQYVAPPSPDYGNYLTIANILRGYDLRGSGLRYNPLFFVFLNAFRIFFDDFNALKILASLVFSIIAVPFFILAKKLSGSYLAALVGSWVFLFFEGYAEMIAWGGNPNFLAFSFMLLTLFFLIGSLKDPSRRNLLLAGFSLGLVMGTHFLVAVFTFLFLLAFVSLTFVFDRKDLPRTIKVVLCVSAIAAVFGLPYFPLYVAFVMNSSSDLVTFNFLTQLNAAGAGLLWMVRSQYLIVMVVAGLGIFAVWRQAKKERSDMLVLCCLYILPFVLTLVTENPDRWFYFLPIPAVLSFALYLGVLFPIIRDARKEILALGCCFILMAGVGSTVLAINRLQSAVDYYQTVGSDELQALKWVKDNTRAQAIFATSGPNRIIGGDTMPGNSYSWWIEGYAGRKCLQTGLTRWHTYSDERLETEITNRFFAGTYVFEYGNVRVSEVFPAGSNNPGIAAYVADQYQNLVFFNDGEEVVVFSPKENDQIVWNQAPFYSEGKTMSLYRNETWTNATFTYDWSRLRLTRTMIMNSANLGVEVVFKLTPSNSTLKQFTINIWGAYHTSLLDAQINDSTILLDQKVQTGDIVKTKIEVVNTNANLNNTEVLFKDPKYSLALATYTLTPLDDDIYADIRISITAENSRASSSGIGLYDSYELMQNLRINYVFLNKARQIEYNRFLYDPEHYSRVFENNTIIIFEVDRGEK